MCSPIELVIQPVENQWDWLFASLNHNRGFWEVQNVNSVGPTTMAGDQDLCGIVLRQWLLRQKRDCFGESEAIGLKPVAGVPDPWKRET